MPAEFVLLSYLSGEKHDTFGGFLEAGYDRTPNRMLFFVC